MSLGLQQIFNTMTSAMSAQSIRMNIIASNLANTQSEGSSEEATFKSKHPVFQEVKQKIPGLLDSDQPIGGVRVVDVQESKKPLEFHYDANNPLADENGRVYSTDVNPINELTDMSASTREYQSYIQVMNTVKGLILQSIGAMKD